LFGHIAFWKQRNAADRTPQEEDEVDNQSEGKKFKEMNKFSQL